MNKEKEYVIKVFDRQIKNELKQNLSYAISEQNLYTNEIMQWKTNKKNLSNCISYFMKEIFLESFNFTIYDWRIIRTEEYFIQLNLLFGIDKKKYLLQCIKIYKNKYNL